MDFFCDWLVVILTIILSLRYLKKIVNNSRYIIYVLFVLFFVLPIILDVLFMTSDYSRARYYGFRLSQSDYYTKIIYDFFVIYCQLIILFWKTKSDEKVYNNNLKEVKIILKIFAILPLLLCLLLPVNHEIIYTFQWRELGLFEYNHYISVLEKLSYIAMCSSALLFLDKKESKISKLIYG